MMSRTVLTLIIIFLIGFMTSGFWTRAKVEGMSTLLKAAAKGDVILMKEALDQGADPNEKGPMGVTAIVFSIRKDNLEAVKLLVATDVDLDAKPGGKSLIFIAEESGATEIADYLKDLSTN